MKMASVAMVFVLAICLAVVSACDGGDGDITARDISDEELALMVLPQQELGGEYAELQLDEETSGFVTNEETIEEAHDPADEGQDIERFGRVNGYFEAYSSGNGAFVGEHAPYVATGVELLRDSESASARLEDEMADYEIELSAQAEEQQAREVDLVPFSPGNLGDEASGLDMHVAFPLNGGLEVSYNGSYVAFRRGRLVGAVVVGQFDGELEDKDRRDRIVALARKLDERIQAVLRGDITPAPTPALYLQPTLL